MELLIDLGLAVVGFWCLTLLLFGFGLWGSVRRERRHRHEDLLAVRLDRLDNGWVDWRFPPRKPKPYDRGTL